MIIFMCLDDVVTQDYISCVNHCHVGLTLQHQLTKHTQLYHSTTYHTMPSFFEEACYALSCVTAHCAIIFRGIMLCYQSRHTSHCAIVFCSVCLLSSIGAIMFVCLSSSVDYKSITSNVQIHSHVCVMCVDASVDCSKQYKLTVYSTKASSYSMASVSAPPARECQCCLLESLHRDVQQALLPMRAVCNTNGIAPDAPIVWVLTVNWARRHLIHISDLCSRVPHTCERSY